MSNDEIRAATGCPNCGVQVGEKCVTTVGGLEMPELVHQSRRRYAINGWVFRP